MKNISERAAQVDSRVLERPRLSEYACPKFRSVFAARAHAQLAYIFDVLPFNVKKLSCGAARIDDNCGHFFFLRTFFFLFVCIIGDWWVRAGYDMCGGLLLVFGGWIVLN